MVTKQGMRQLNKSGRTAIEYCMLGVAVRSRIKTEADEEEVK